jgi:hypothetical protein
VALARLVLEVASGDVAPSAQITVGDLLVRWVEHRRRAWEARSPGQPDWTLNVIRKHFIPRVGDLQLGKLRSVDIDHMYSRWRQDGMAESPVRRMHNLLHSAVGQAVRWDLIPTNPADRIERPQPVKSKVTDQGRLCELGGWDSNLQHTNRCRIRRRHRPAPSLSVRDRSHELVHNRGGARCSTPSGRPHLTRSMPSTRRPTTVLPPASRER